MKRFYFVRHGESEANVAQTLDPSGKSPLTPKGELQSSQLAQRFTSLPLDVIISSSLVRTRQTAEIFNAKLQKPLQYSNLLVENRVPSEFAGIPSNEKSYKEIRLEIKNNQHKPSWHYSDEENFEELKDRGQKALEYLADHKEENLVIITHGYFLRMLFSLMLHGEQLNIREFMNVLCLFTTKNTGITICEYDEKNQNHGWRLITWMDHAHLGDN